MGIRHGAVALIAACLLTAAASPARAEVPTACAGEDAAAVVCIVNQGRRDFFSHVDPQGTGPADRVLASAYADRQWTAAESLDQASDVQAGRRGPGRDARAHVRPVHRKAMRPIFGLLLRCQH